MKVNQVAVSKGKYVVLSITGAQCAPNTETTVLFERGDISKRSRIQKAVCRSGFENGSFDRLN